MANNKTRPIPYLSEAEIQRFWSSVDKSGGPNACWPWTAGCFQPSGYGRFNIPIAKRYEGFYANRIAIFLTHGLDPGPLMACHSCDVRYAVGDISYRKCCNGDHLFTGTGRENTLDAMAKGRMASGDRNGSRLYPERLRYGSRPECGVKGEDNGSSKLTNQQIIEIRNLYKGQGKGPSQQAIAMMFGVSQVLIGNIVRGDNWKHI